MFSVRLRFAAFGLGVLLLPAVLIGSGQTDLQNLGKLAMILGPAVLGNALAWGLKTERPALRPSEILRAAIITLAIVLSATATALILGKAHLGGLSPTPQAVATAMAGSGLTSVLEELGWAAGGLTLARQALGPRLGVLGLGAIWALWHLVPVHFRIGLFPDLETAPPAMIAAFIAACLVYRALLTRLCDCAGSWLGAAAGHAAPNIVMAGLIAGGLGGWSGSWWAFPAPGGLIFLALAAGALIWVSRARFQPAS
ncbi:MAG: hypothetical protein CFE28_14595 [Alphaproteobacteria bacterium PA2]|nr:MAG: hypothetical protein CFE28_14595 [Alphaproteobacteria bacterium PA2]